MVYLVPSLLAENALEALPDYLLVKVKECNIIFAENIRTTRRFLKQLDKDIDIDSYQWFEIGKTEPKLVSDFRAALKADKNIAIISEAGCPGVADPGYRLITEAHKMNTRVVPLVGPNSIILALMASGLNGQQFTFHGYLPIKGDERQRAIQKLEIDSKKTGYTQIFIETPYRNEALLEDLIKSCQGNTLLCVASELTGKDEYIRTLPLREWRKEPHQLHKRTAIFLISA